MLLKLVCFCLLWQYSYSEDKRPSNSKKFIPTNEWQVVEPGQHIPAGLHIRSDIYKGVTEAKLLDEECEECDKTGYPIQQYTDEDVLEQVGKQFAEIDSQARDDKPPQRNYRSYEEIKAEMRALNITIEDEPSAIKAIIKRFEDFNSQKNTDNADEFSVFLQDLEYYLHHIDNAQYFFKQKGLTRVIFPALNFPQPDLQKLALRLLSGAVQHNPAVQLEAVNSNTILVLYRLLDSEHQSVVLSTLNTISNVIKKFPSAQLAFLRYGGFTKVFGLVEKKEYFDNSRFKNRVLALMLDYYQDNDNNSIEATADKASADHSKLIMKHFTEHFKEDGWCEIIRKFTEKTTLGDHDVTEKLFPLILHTKGFCSHIYNEKHFKDRLEAVVKFYEQEAMHETEEILKQKENGFDLDEDVDNLFYNNFKEFLQNLLQLIYSNGKKVEHHEL